jgi:hypothetical protein
MAQDPHSDTMRTLRARQFGKIILERGRRKPTGHLRAIRGP